MPLQARSLRAECAELNVFGIPTLSWIQPPSGPAAAISTRARSISNIGVRGSTNIPKPPKGGGGDSGATNELCSAIGEDQPPGRPGLPIAFEMHPEPVFLHKV